MMRAGVPGVLIFWGLEQEKAIFGAKKPFSGKTPNWFWENPEYFFVGNSCKYTTITDSNLQKSYESYFQYWSQGCLIERPGMSDMQGRGIKETGKVY